MLQTEAVVRSCSVKKMFLEILQNSQENTCARDSFIKKESLARELSCEFCEISKNTFFTEHLWWLLLFREVLSFFIENHLKKRVLKTNSKNKIT